MRKTEDHTGWETRSARSHRAFRITDLIASYTARYPASYAFTKQYEGGYVNDPDDPGGCTNMGITIGTLTAWRAPGKVTCEDVRALSEPEVGLIYFTNYWATVWGNELPIGLNTQTWDWGVNSGPYRSLLHLQRMAGAPDDGIMGPVTLAAVVDWVSDIGITAACRAYHDDRQAYYESLSAFSKYGAGWTRRNDDCLTLALQLAEEGPAVLPVPDQPWAPGVGAGADLVARVAALEGWAASFSPRA